MKGYLGKLLDIDLTKNEIKEMLLEKDMLTKFLGGRGLGIKLLYDLLPKNTDPLSEENIMIFLTGPLTGTIAPGAGKFVVVTKSPVSNGFLDSYSSGRFAVELKFAGYDGIILRGKAKKPSKILIQDKKISIDNAEHLWGKDTFETESYLQSELKDQELGTICIGPAGENLVKYASINSDYYRQAARGGIGAVMGSKNIKAISVRGTNGLVCHDSHKMVEIILEHKKLLDKSPVVANRMRYGTPSTLDITNEAGMLPTKNYQIGNYKKAKNTLDSSGVEKSYVKSRGCYGCMIACSKISKVSEGEFKNDIVEGPEYETVGMFGSNLGIDYLPAIIKANIECDRLGLDTISTGNTIGFFMECSEKNILPEELKKYGINFGDYKGMLKLIEKIAFKKEEGSLLSEGVKLLSQKIGNNSSKFAMHVKGLEFAAYDPRIGLGTSLSYAVSPRGACHRRAWPPAIEVLGKLKPYTIEGKAELIKKMVDENTVFHSLLICDFPAKWIPLEVKEFIGYIETATGYKYQEKDLWEVADRVETLIRMFNNREGLTREDDTLPRRIFEDKLMNGSANEKSISERDLDTLLSDYYEIRGWNTEGIPKENKIKELNII